MPKHKEEEKFWGYLIEADKSPTPLFQALLMGIAHYIIKNVAPWDTKTLTPSKMAHFYRLVGGNYDSLFLESPNASIAFIYKSLGCYHSLQPTRDPFAAPSIPALTNDGFVRWQTVQLLLGPDEHVPFLQEAVKRFEIKNPIEGGYFPRFLPAEALPRKPDPEMCRWHDEVGERLFRESGAADKASIIDPPPSLEDGPITDAGPYVRSPPPSADARRPNSFGQNMATPEARVSHHAPGLRAPPTNVRRHSVPDRERGEFAAERPPNIYASPTSADSIPSPDGGPASRHSSQEAAINNGHGGPASRPTSSRQDTAHRRSSSSISPPRRHPGVPRSHSHDRPGSISHSRSPPRWGPVPVKGVPAPQPQAHAQVPPPQPQRPPLSAADVSRRHTTYTPKDYAMPQQRAATGAVDASGRPIYPVVPPHYYPPPGQPKMRHASVSAGVSPPQPGVATNVLPSGMQATSPPTRQTQFPPTGPSPIGVPVGVPMRPAQHPPPPAPVPQPSGMQPPPNTPYARPPAHRHHAASAAMRPSSSSSDPPLPAPNPAAVAAAAPSPGMPPGVRFAPDPNTAPTVPINIPPEMIPGVERRRRRTIEEEARERERAREEMDFEYGRRRQRPLAGALQVGGQARRSRSGGDRND